MKKITMLFAIIVMFVLQLNVVSAADKGDVNKDGYVNVKDKTLLQMYISNTASKSQKKMVEANGDINGDGKINVKDITAFDKILDNNNDKSNGNVDLDKTYSNFSTSSVSCGLDEETGTYLVSGIPKSIPKVVHIVYIVIQVVVPIIIVIFGMIDLIKAVIASKEDEIKKAQMTFIKRLIAGALVFFVFVGVKLLISVVGDSNNSPRIMDCASCFLNGTGNCVSK